MTATARQLNYARMLLAERDIDKPHADVILKTISADVTTPNKASRVIDLLKELPRKPMPELEPGIYLVDGVVYQVKLSKSSSNRYACVLDKETRRFEYAPGAIRLLPVDAHSVTVDEALAFGIANGICIKGHPLTDPLSVALGVGPKCVHTLFGCSQAELARQRGITL